MSEISKKIIGQIKISSEIVKQVQEKIKDLSDFKEKIEKIKQGNVTDIISTILIGTIQLNVSDIHIEPREEQTILRVRLDGILQETGSFEQKTYQTILSRIKLLSGLKLNISDIPQDGRFTILIPSLEKNIKEEIIEIRTSSLPSKYGESLVLRILNPKSLISLEELGLREDLLDIFKKEIEKPHGMIIVTGPTGSGKTTTLYAFLKTIQNPEIKIITIEDPIEYRLEGISQTQTAPKRGYDFASGLKSIMRQDPDVILVGEMRDSETAKIAIQAALTGHLVFSTLHTNDAAGTIARLVNLGVRTSDMGPAVNMIVAQRLIRKVCKKCCELKEPSSLILDKIRKELEKVSIKIKIPLINENLKIPFISQGCKHCNFTGYKGRTGILEAFLIDEEMEKFIIDNPPISSLREKAIKNGMLTIKQDGIIKILKGETTIEEIERVAGE
jgi:type II secretory ATPase GspE/PulE/Tfp pilus assembly ATPase PilB-like protein